jgi:bifunctional non-homologous end joining protein LigD
VFIVFDLLDLNGMSTAALSLIKRKGLLLALFARPIRGLRSSDHVVGDGRRFHEQACLLGVEGVVSKRVVPVHSSNLQECGGSLICS